MFPIEFDNNKYVVGLKWSRLAGEKVSAELSAISKETEMHFGFTRKIEDDGQFVYQSALSSEKSANGMVSAAAIVADLVENIILIQKISEEKYWVCCVNDSEIVPGGDELIDTELVVDKFHELVSEFTSDDVRFCIDKSISESLTNKTEDLQFEDILEENQITKPLKDFSHYKLKSLKGIPAAGALFGVFAIVLAGGAFLFTQSSGPLIVDVEHIKLPEIKINKPDIVKLDLKPKVASQTELLQNAREEEIDWLKEKMIKEDPFQLVNAIGEFTYGLPRFFYGWSAAQVIYNNKDKNTITVVWHRNELGTSLSLQKTIQNNIDISFSLDGSSARTTHAITGLVDRLVEDDIVSSIKNDEYKTAEFMHDVESLGLNWSVELLSQDISRKEKIKNIKNQQEAVTKQLKLKGKYFTVRGGRINSLYVFNDIFTKSKSSLIEEITINLNENNWTVNGVLYEK